MIASSINSGERIEECIEAHSIEDLANGFLNHHYQTPNLTILEFAYVYDKDMKAACEEYLERQAKKAKKKEDENIDLTKSLPEGYSLQYRSASDDATPEEKKWHDYAHRNLAWSNGQCATLEENLRNACSGYFSMPQSKDEFRMVKRNDQVIWEYSREAIKENQRKSNAMKTIYLLINMDEPYMKPKAYESKTEAEEVAKVLNKQAHDKIIEEAYRQWPKNCLKLKDGKLYLNKREVNLCDTYEVIEISLVEQPQ